MARTETPETAARRRRRAAGRGGARRARDGGELGTNELARRPASTPARSPACSPRSSRPGSPSTSRRAVATGWGFAWWSSETRARPPRPARGRPAAPACARRGNRRDGHPLGARRPGRDHRRLRPERILGAERGARREAEHVHATATGKVALAFGDVALPRGRLGVHRADDRRSRDARAGGRARPRAGLGAGDRRARGRSQRSRCSGAREPRRARGGARDSGSRHASARKRWSGPSSRSSSVQPRSPTL